MNYPSVYQYDYEKATNLFTDDGQRMFIKIRDRAKTLLDQAGCFRLDKVISGCTGSSWTMIACVDRMVELGEIVEIRRDVMGQYRIFTARFSD